MFYSTVFVCLVEFVFVFKFVSVFSFVFICIFPLVPSDIPVTVMFLHVNVACTKLPVCEDSFQY